MNFLPKASGMRPRVACEIAPGGVAAARSDVAGGPLVAVAAVTLADGALAPGLKPGNVVDRVEVAAAVRKALEDVGAKPNARNADVTVVIPDGACRVLLLEFDALPNKLSEALPLVRFRLKKLVPFDADDAMVSFQVMSQSKQMVRVLAVAIPRDVLSEYETAAREAGFEPGAVIPSTLAAMAAVEDASASLLVNVSKLSVTAAIQRDGILLLHRTVDLALEPAGVPATMPAALFEPSGATGVDEFLPHRASALDGDPILPLVSVEDTAGEWAAQEPLPEHGRNPYADTVEAETAVQGAEAHNAVLIAEAPLGALVDLDAAHLAAIAAAGTHTELPVEARDVEALPPAEFAREVAQAVSVAAAYFEDTLAMSPERIASAGSLSASGLQRILNDAGLADAEGLRVRELVTSEMLAADAVSAKAPRGSLAGVMGALRG